MSDNARCPQCGVQLPAKIAAQLCPKCLMAAGFGTDATVLTDEVKQKAQTSTEPFAVAFIEELNRLLPQFDFLNCWAVAAWGRSTKHVSVTWIERSRSRFCRVNWPMHRDFRNDLRAKPRPLPVSIIRTS